MSGQIVKRPRSLQDLDEIASYIQRESGPDQAIRFLRATNSTLTTLAGMPGIGARYEPDGPIQTDLRYFPINRHRKYLVFFRPFPNGIEVLRVLHGARDIAGLLAEEFGVDCGADDHHETDEIGP